MHQDDGTNTEHFVHLPRGIHAVDDGTDWNFYAQDGLGSVRAVVDDMAMVQSSMSYDPYGNPMASYGAGFGFTGEQTDANGSVFLRARYYEPGLGVFSALDPFEGMQNRPMSLNGYSWVECNPVMNTDPSGLCNWLFWGCAGSIAFVGDAIFLDAAACSAFAACVGSVAQAFQRIQSALSGIDLTTIPFFTSWWIAAENETNIVESTNITEIDITDQVIQQILTGQVTAPTTTVTDILIDYNICLTLNSGVCETPLRIPEVGTLPPIVIPNEPLVPNLVYARGGDRVPGVARQVNVGRNMATGECNTCSTDTYCVVDRVATGSSRSDEVCPGQDHYHKYVYNLNPQTCICYLNRAIPYVNCLPPGGMPPTSDCTYTIF